MDVHIFHSFLNSVAVFVVAISGAYRLWQMLEMIERLTTQVADLAKLTEGLSSDVLAHYKARGN